MDVEEEVDRLYALPLDEFTGARNELAKQLRKDGLRDEAVDVKALAKPSVAAWAVNQLVRRRGPRVRALLEAADAVRAAQEQALAGRGADELREAARRERELVADLRREVRELLAGSGRAASDSTLERVATTLTSAAVDPESRPLLEAGRLTEEVEASGFDAFAGMTVPAAAAAPARPRRAAEKPKRVAPAPAARPAVAGEERARLAELKEHARALGREARQADRDAQLAERRAKRLATEAERAAQTAEQATADAAAAANDAAALRSTADAARAEADRAAAALPG